LTTYNYTARDANGRAIKSYCDAAGETTLRSQLKAMGYTVDSISKRPASQLNGQRKRVKLQDIVNMCRRFSVMYAAGLSLMDCLSVLARENESKKLSDSLDDIHDKIAEGSNVSDAFSNHSEVFSPLFINTLRAGEVSGKFDFTLDQLATYLEKQYDLRRKIFRTLTYPFVVMSTIFVVVTLIMIFVVPAFSSVYLKLGIELPTPTRALIFISSNAMYIFPTIALLTAGIWLLYIKVRRVPQVKDWMDRAKLLMPISGTVGHKIILLRFLRTLSVMITAGMRLPEAIAIADDVADNAVVSDAANMIQNNIKRGGTITDATKLHSFFPPTIVHAFGAGEEAGNLNEILGSFADGIEQDVDDVIKKLVIKIEPALVLLLTMVIGFIAMAIYLPIFDLMKMLRQ
jgi:type IV pilus assembly protein PilC